MAYEVTGPIDESPEVRRGYRTSAGHRFIRRKARTAWMESVKGTEVQEGDRKDGRLVTKLLAMCWSPY